MQTKQQRIEELEAELSRKSAMLDAALEGMTRLHMHMQGPKFMRDTTIQTGDVCAWLNTIRNNVADVEVLPFGWAHSLNERVATADGGHGWDCLDFKRYGPPSKYTR